MSTTPAALHCLRTLFARPARVDAHAAASTASRRRRKSLTAASTASPRRAVAKTPSPRPRSLRRAATMVSEPAQNQNQNHPRHREMDTSHVEGTATPQDAATPPSISSCSYKAGTMPVVSMLFKNSRNPSSATCASVNKKTTSLVPKSLYKVFKSSLNSISP